MNYIDVASSTALAACSAEPIHIPGSIQPHGALLACSPESWKVTHVSANALHYLGLTPEQILGCDLSSTLGATSIAALETAEGRAGSTGGTLKRNLAIVVDTPAGLRAASIHNHDGRRIIEVELVEAESAQPLELVGGILQELQKSTGIGELCQSTVAQLRRLTGFDRVMIYRFLQDGAGQVVAEDCRDGLPSLMNLRYPASDIPVQARELYKRSWIRLIADVAAPNVPLLAGSEAGPRPLDLSHAALRSVSPIHIEYLGNMGVGASMSVSIIVGGELWGLIACHHKTARVVPASVRAAIELIGQMFSLQIQTVEGIEAYVTMRAARALLDRIVAEIPIDSDLVEDLAQRLEQLAAFIPSQGVCLWLEGQRRSTGLAPSSEAIASLARLADAHRGQGLYLTHALHEALPESRDWGVDIAGVMAVPLSHTGGDYLFFFRSEVARTVEWGGNPYKITTAAMPGIDRPILHPRKSFELWREEVKGQSAPWTSRERLIAETLRIYLLDIILRFGDVIREERRKAEQQQRLVVGELNQRVKGTLELIQSLVARGGEEAQSIPSFARALQGRIGAIAVAHNAIAARSSCDIRDLIEGALTQHGTSAQRVLLSGPDIQLDPKAYTVLALVLHELATHAVEQGALSSQSGRVEIRWSLTRTGELGLSWSEGGGWPHRLPVVTSTGMLIVRHNIPHTLGGEAEVEVDGDGLRARILLPRRYVVEPRGQLADAGQKLIDEPRQRPLEGVSVLVVEDHLLSALGLAEDLKRLGAVAVETAGTLERAMDLIEQRPPDCAVLDIDLGEGASLQLADFLSDAGIPFVLAVQDTDAAAISQRHADTMVTRKPYEGDAVAAALRDSLMPHLIRAVLTKLV